MNWRLWMEFIIILVLSNFTTGVISWYRSRKNERELQKYRSEKAKLMEENIPYGDRFRKDLNLDPQDWQRTVRHTRRKINGRWTED
jgi:hypothetical protein